MQPKYDMTIGEWITHCGKVAKEHGWHDKPSDFGEYAANFHGEIAEAWEEFRKGKRLDETYYVDAADYSSDGNRAPLMKPEGIPVELGDVLIRIFDFCYRYNVNVEKAMLEKSNYNAQRSYRHGNKVA